MPKYILRLSPLVVGIACRYGLMMAAGISTNSKSESESELELIRRNRLGGGVGREVVFVEIPAANG
jgi:hypothetical protein